MRKNQAAANKRWREKNPDKWAACQRRWREKNRDKIRVYNRRHYLRTADVRRAAAKKYYHTVVKLSPDALAKQRALAARWYRSPAGREWFARWRKRTRVRQRKFNRNWSKNNPHKWRAHSAVAQAIKAGTLVRVPCPCGEKKSEAHHHDYSRPLDVEFLCRACHRKEHAAEKKNSP